MNTFLRVALLSGSLGIGGIISANAQVGKSPKPIQVKINNNVVHFGGAPVIKNGNLLVPLRGFLEAMGGEVNYQADTRNIRVDIHGATVEMKVGARHIYVNGRERVLPKPLPLINGHIMVQVRSVAEKMGATVDWNAVQRTVLIKNLKTETANTPPEQGIRAGTIEVRTIANKSTFHTGETVHFTVIATNTDDRPRSLTLPSGQTFDITITPTGKDMPQWKWSHGKAFTMAIRYVELKPGQELTFKTEWGQKDNDGQTMPRGEVDVNAMLVSMNAGIKAKVMKLQLVN